MVEGEVLLGGEIAIERTMQIETLRMETNDGLGVVGAAAVNHDDLVAEVRDAGDRPFEGERVVLRDDARTEQWFVHRFSHTLGPVSRTAFLLARVLMPVPGIIIQPPSSHRLLESQIAHRLKYASCRSGAVRPARFSVESDRARAATDIGLKPGPVEWGLSFLRMMEAFLVGVPIIGFDQRR
jgi:hypothetical protein